MTMLHLFLTLFASQFILVTPRAIEREQVGYREEPPSLEANKTISDPESSDPKIPEAPWTDVRFPLDEAEHDIGTCRKVPMYVSFADIGLSDEIIAPDGFNAYQCKGKCSSTRQKKFPNRSAIMALLEEKKGLKIDDEACCVPTKLSPISALVFQKNGHIVLRKLDDMVVDECGCQ